MKEKETDRVPADHQLLFFVFSRRSTLLFRLSECFFCTEFLPSFVFVFSLSFRPSWLTCSTCFWPRVVPFRVSIASICYYLVRVICACFYRVLPSFTEFHRVFLLQRHDSLRSATRIEFELNYGFWPRFT